MAQSIGRGAGGDTFMAIHSFLKGLAGEFLNRVGHRLYLPRKQYHTFHNIVIPSGTGTTEIDHVIVSEFGIFVVETKYWSGWFFGTEWDKHWTRVHFRSKRQVPNPLHQNYGHVMALSELLGMPPERFRPLVAIRGATFKTALPQGVVAGGYAKHVRRPRDPDLDPAEVAGVLAVLRSDRVGRGWIARLRHAWFTKAKPSPLAVIEAPKARSKRTATAATVGGLMETTPPPLPRPRTPVQPPALPISHQPAFCIGCAGTVAFDPARPMCPTCYRDSRMGSALQYLSRPSCHQCGLPNSGRLSKPICRECWTQLPKSVQQSITASLK
ncbi:MAG: NERD domain-containing protein [Planctomycetes bacterium]|nr:NERD domain-containing protein [Planctomycetota bacterium]